MLVTERGSRTPGFAGAPLRPPPPPPPAPAPELITYESMGGPSYPGNYAVPGLMWPGFILPAEPVTASAPPASDEWIFTGNYTCIYPQHIDATTDYTLTAQPGGSYNINPVGGDPGVTEPPGDGRWIHS